MEVGVELINKNGGFGDRQVEFVLADDRTDPARKLAEMLLAVPTRSETPGVVNPARVPVKTVEPLGCAVKPVQLPPEAPPLPCSTASRMRDARLFVLVSEEP